METVSENRCFGGVQGVYRHQAETTGCDMTFAVQTFTSGCPTSPTASWIVSGLTRNPGAGRGGCSETKK